MLIETARYHDEQKAHLARTQPIREAANSVYALKALVDFWAGYIPDIYGLAKALMMVRATDEDAASAWNDRMAAFYEKCSLVAQGLHAENQLAADFVWATLSIANWEHLTLDRGWTHAQYVERIQTVLRRVLIKT